MRRTTLTRDAARRSGDGGAAGNLPQPCDDLPLADGVAAPGFSPKYARCDHVHPADLALNADYNAYRIRDATVDVYTGARPDQLYCAGVHAFASNTVIQGGFPARDKFVAFPFVCPRPIKLKDLVMGCGVVAGNVGVAVYANLADGELYPGELLAGGNFVTDALAIHRYTLAVNVTLDPGIYWFASANDADCGMWTTLPQYLFPFLGTQSDFSVDPTSPAFGVGWQHDALPNYGAVMPDPFPIASPAMLTSNNTATRYPAIFMRLGSP